MTIETDERLERRREKVARLVNAGLTEREIASELGVSRSTIFADKQVLVSDTRYTLRMSAFRAFRR